MKEIFITENSAFYKKGQILQCEIKNNKIFHKNNFIPKSQYLELNEALSTTDENRIKDIVNEILEKMFWRIYTRSSFILK